jgi:hypothetical protein
MVDKPESWDILLNDVDVEVNGDLGEIKIFS